MSFVPDTQPDAPPAAFRGGYPFPRAWREGFLSHAVSSVQPAHPGIGQLRAKDVYKMVVGWPRMGFCFLLLSHPTKQVQVVPGPRTHSPFIPSEVSHHTWLRAKEESKLTLHIAVLVVQFTLYNIYSR